MVSKIKKLSKMDPKNARKSKKEEEKDEKFPTEDKSEDKSSIAFVFLALNLYLDRTGQQKSEEGHRKD